MAIRDDQTFTPFDRLADEARDRPGEVPGVRARAVELLESVEPIHFPSGRKQRLLLSLGRGSVKQRWTWLRPAVVAVVLLGGGAVASAALTGWPTRLVRSLETRVSPEEAKSPSIPRARGVHAAPTIQPAAVIDSHPATRQPPASPARHLPVEARPRRQVELPSDDPSLLVGATRALRIDRDPELARALAKRYLDGQPGGALADEALAISIEAAIDHHDADAATLSARYLAQFPHGSFRALAERTLASQRR
jgi:hypothetical protein